jgi:hypothetical protein
VLANRRPDTVLALKSRTVDLEFTRYKIERGRTYHNDGIGVFDVYIEEGTQGRFVCRDQTN